MEFIRLGKTDIMVSRSALDTDALFSAVEDGDASAEDFAGFMHAAYESGINFFSVSAPRENAFAADPPEAFSKLSDLLNEIRKSVKLAFISDAATGPELENDVRRALDFWHIDYFDLCRIRDPGFVPSAGSSLYESLKKLHESGTILHTGFASDNCARIKEAAAVGLYEAVQFPYNFLAGEQEDSCVDLCAEYDIGFIAEKPLARGLIKNVPLAFGFFRRSENAVPLWRIKTEEELQRIVYFEKNPPVIDEQFLKDLDEEKKRLSETE